MAPQLAALAHGRSDVKVRIVDIQTVLSPVARQHGITGLPRLWLYEHGKLFSKDLPAVMARLSAPK